MPKVGGSWNRVQKDVVGENRVSQVRVESVTEKVPRVETGEREE